MLCGQGSVGKSTYGIWLSNQLNNSILIRVDDIVFSSSLKKFDFTSHFHIYIKQINEAIKNNKENIIIDFSHDSCELRKKICSKISLKQSINFITISLRPSIDFIILNDEKRKQRKLSLSEKERIKKIYEHFEFPSLEEFKNYNFQTVKNFIIDNSKLFSIPF